MFSGVDGKYSKVSDTVWANEDGTFAIRNLVHGGMEGCPATNGVPNSNCGLGRNRKFAKIQHSLYEPENGIYSWGGKNFGRIQFTGNLFLQTCYRTTIRSFLVFAGLARLTSWQSSCGHFYSIFFKFNFKGTFDRSCKILL